MSNSSFDRNAWLTTRADVLAGTRANDLAWAAFRMDRGLPPAPWHLCGSRFVRAHRREGDAWRVAIGVMPFLAESDVAATVVVDDRSGACAVTFNPQFAWDDADGLVEHTTPPMSLCPRCGVDLASWRPTPT